MGRVMKFAVFGVVAVAVFGFVVRGLWNWLMPPLFGLHALTFWQALGPGLELDSLRRPPWRAGMAVAASGSAGRR